MADRKLPEFEKNGVRYIVDFRLEEIRQVNAPLLSISFDDLTEGQRATIRRIRAIYWDTIYVRSLDN